MAAMSNTECKNAIGQKYCTDLDSVGFPAKSGQTIMIIAPEILPKKPEKQQKIGQTKKQLGKNKKHLRKTTIVT